MEDLPYYEGDSLAGELSLAKEHWKGAREGGSVQRSDLLNPELQTFRCFGELSMHLQIKISLFC